MFYAPAVDREGSHFELPHVHNDALLGTVLLLAAWEEKEAQEMLRSNSQRWKITIKVRCLCSCY